jgi:hypothetical protein
VHLRSAIRVDEVQCVHIWNAYLREIVLEGQKGLDPSRLKSIETVIQVRDFHFGQGQYLWKILQEIIRIDGDRSHVYHDPVSRYLDKLLEKYASSHPPSLYLSIRHRGLVPSLLSSLEKLYNCDLQPPNVSQSSH